MWYLFDIVQNVKGNHLGSIYVFSKFQGHLPIRFLAMVTLVERSLM